MQQNILKNQKDGYIRWNEIHQGETIDITNTELASDRNIKINEIHGNTWQDPNNLDIIKSVGELYVDADGNPVLDKGGKEQYKIDIESNDTNGQSNKTTILLPQPLREIGEGIVEKLCWDVEKQHYCINTPTEIIDLSHINTKLELNAYSPTIRITNGKGEAIGNMVVEIPYRKIIEPPTKPINLTFVENNETGHIISWGASLNATGYHVCVDETRLLSTEETTCVVNGELSGNLKVIAYNSAYQVESDPITIETNVNAPTDFKVGMKKVGSNCVFDVSFRDNSDIEKGHKVVYLIDGTDEFVLDVPPTQKGVVAKQITIPTTSFVGSVLFKLATVGKTLVYATNEIPFEKPKNVKLTTIGTTTTITWDEMVGVDSFNIYLDSKIVTTTVINQVIIKRDLYGSIRIVPVKDGFELISSDDFFIKTVPNKPLWVDVNHEKTELGNDFRVEFTDNSVIETHYRVEYQIDDGKKQSFNIDTENMELPPNTYLDEDKTYLMWSDIEKRDGTDVDIQGVEGEQIKSLKIGGNTDTTGYYPMSIGTVDPLTVGVNEEKNPIRFETVIKSTDGSPKKVVDVARFQDINMIIEGKTVRDEVNNTLDSVKPMIYNEKGIAHTITLDNCKGYTEIRYDKLASREEYGCTLGKVGNVIDQLYKDRVVYRTKEYLVTGRESWQIDSAKTNGTYTVISNIVLDNCPIYGADEVFNVISNKFTPQAYSDTNYTHLKCMYTDKLTLMFQNTQVGITGIDSTASKITKCKNYLIEIGASVRYEVDKPTEEAKEINLFVGDSFELGHVGERKEICNTSKGEVYIKTGEIIIDGTESFSTAYNEVTNNVHYYTSHKFADGASGHNQPILCSHFPYSIYGWNDTRAKNTITTSNTHYMQVGFTFDKSRFPTVTDFKNWLKLNPVTVRYRLANPHTEKINILQDAFVVDSQDGGDREFELQNFNFIANKVVQNGLVDSLSLAQLNICSTFILKNEVPQSYPFTNLNWGAFTGFEVSSVPTEGFIYLSYGTGMHVKASKKFTKHPNTKYNITVTTKNNIATLFVNGELVDSVEYVFGTKNPAFKGDLLYYNRPLTPQEIAHNFQVLNNPPSISTLEDKSHILQLENQEEKAVSGGTESGFLSGSIEGETVKNLFFKGYSGYAGTNGLKMSYVKEDGKTTGVRAEGSSDWNGNCLIIHSSQDVEFETNKDYYLVYHLKTNMQSITNKTTRPVVTSVPTVSFTSTYNNGWNISKITSRTSYTNNKGNPHIYPYSDDFDNPDKYIEITNIMLFDSYIDVVEYLEGGLQSTQAVININDQEYPIYNPIIEGKTKVLKNGVEVAPQVGAILESLNSTDSSLPSLGSVHDTIFDTLDFNTGKCTLNTKEIRLTGEESWAISQEFTNTTCFVYNTRLNTTTKGICNSIPYKYNRVDEKHIYIDKGSLNVFMPKMSIAKFKEWLVSNPTFLRCQIVDTEVLYLSQNKVVSYRQHRTTIELSRVGSIKDEIILNEDGSGTWIKRLRFINLDTLNYTSLNANNLYGGIHHDTSIMYGANRGKVISTHYDNVNPSYFNEKTEASIGLEGWAGNTCRIWVANPKSVTPDFNSFIDWIQTNKPKAIIELATPQTIHIPKHLMPHIQIQQNY